jgi:mannose-6-phosphate isomerase-like protein (cupin superfamily)
MTIDQKGLWMQDGDGQGPKYWVFFGDLCTIKAVGEDTGESYALVEFVVRPDNGPPPHVHTRENESFFIREGTMEFHLDDETVIATAGTFLHSPKGQRHYFRNIGSTPAKMLVWVTPAGLEKFFAEAGIPAEGELTLSPPVRPDELDRILELSPKYGVEVMLPPSLTAPTD